VIACALTPGWKLLKESIFGLNNLTDKRIAQLTSWYRHLLAHGGQIATGAGNKWWAVRLRPNWGAYADKGSGILRCCEKRVEITKPFTIYPSRPARTPDLFARAPESMSSLAWAASGIALPSQLSGKKK
jgi:hypothetical protein